MPGGLLQIASSGIQDVYLTKNPEITFFKKVYKRNTNFSLETIEIVIDNIPEYGNTFFITIPKQGDLLYRCFFEVELPILHMLDKDYITNRSYFDEKNIKLENLKSKTNIWRREYETLLKYSNIQIKYYNKIKSLLKNDTITFDSIQGEIYLLSESYSQQVHDIVFSIDQDIKTKFSIGSYVTESFFSFGTIDDSENNRITKTTFENNINTLYNNIKNYLTKYWSNYINFKKEYEYISTGLLDYAWIEKIGNYYFSNYEIEIGGQQIVQYSDDYLNLYTDHTLHNKQVKNYNEMIGNISELTNLKSEKKNYKIYIPLVFWFNKNSLNTLPLVSLKNNDIQLNITTNAISKLIYFVDYNKQYEEIKILKIPYSDHTISNKTYLPIKKSLKIDNIEQLETSKVELLAREKVYKYYCKELTRGVIQLAFPSITSLDLDHLFSKYGNQNKLTKEQWIIFQLNIPYDTKLTNISKIINYNNHWEYIDYNFLRNKIGKPKIKFFCEYVYLDEMERYKFASNNLEYIVELPKQINLNIDNVKFITRNIDVLHLTKDMWFFIRPKLQKNGFNDHSYRNPSEYNIYNLHDKIEIIDKLYFFINGHKLINIEDKNPLYYTDVTKLNNNRVPKNDNTYYYSFSLYPEDSQPSGTCNFSVIKGKYIELYLNETFLRKYFNKDLNKYNLGLELVLISNHYTLIQFNKGRINLPIT